MNFNPSVAIAMATYNGSRYVAGQLDSLFAQTASDWVLLIRDDGSTDETAGIVKKYQEAHPGKIAVIEDGQKNLGPRDNFGRLIECAEAEYLMFCDQDDVWLPDKIERTLARMQKLEQRFGRDIPLLVHTDMTVADEDLRPIAPSFWAYQKMDPGRGEHFQRIFIGNVANGCTVMINRKLKDMALPIPPGTIMHDWWLALIAAAFGKIDYIPDQTVLYRLHSRNVVGASPWSLHYLFQKLMQVHDRRALLECLIETGKQAEAFLSRFGSLLTAANREKARAYAGLAEQGPINKRFLVIRHGFLRSGLIRNISLLLRM